MAHREYIWLPLDFAGAGEQSWALPIAPVTEAGTAGPRIHDLHTDQLGTPAAMISGGLGQLESSAVLRPVGEVESITGTKSLALRLPGQVFDRLPPELAPRLGPQAWTLPAERFDRARPRER